MFDMSAQYMLSHESVIRIGLFSLVFALMAFWETRRPRRASVLPKRLRWANNLMLAFLSTFAVRLIFPFAAVGFAVLAEERSGGLMRAWTIPTPFAVLIAIVLLDMAIYIQHILFHAVPALWRFHRVHHADPEFDVTTAMRFHPIELLLSMGIKGVAICALGPPVLAVMIFEVLLNASSIFNHANVRLPSWLDRALRWVVVTPDMHRIHHSMERDETDSNFGFNLSVWDRIFGTYRSVARLPPETLAIGLREFSDPARAIKVLDLLMLPFASLHR